MKLLSAYKTPYGWERAMECITGLLKKDIATVEQCCFDALPLSDSQNAPKACTREGFLKLFGLTLEDIVILPSPFIEVLIEAYNSVDEVGGPECDDSVPDYF